MTDSDPILECARIIQRRGLSAVAIFTLEASKPCIGLLREGIQMAQPLLSVFLGDGRALDLIRSIRTADDAERLIQLLENGASWT